MTTRRVTTSRDAAQALKAARRWLLQAGSGTAARQRWQALAQVAPMLRDYPYLGTSTPDLPGHRHLVVSGYTLIYQLDPDTDDAETAGHVRIVGVYGPGQIPNLINGS